MKRTYISALIFFISLTALSFFCSIWVTRNDNNDNSKDYFYTESGGDSMRIPLVEPYELLKLNQQLEINQKLGWSIELHVPPSKKELKYDVIHDVEEFSVEKQIIMVYSTYSEGIDTLSGQKVLYWFVLVPEENKEIGFETKSEFLNFIQKYKIQEPIWLKPDWAYEKLLSTGCLDWFPNCK